MGSWMVDLVGSKDFITTDIFVRNDITICQGTPERQNRTKGLQGRKDTEEHRRAKRDGKLKPLIIILGNFLLQLTICCCNQCTFIITILSKKDTSYSLSPLGKVEEAQEKLAPAPALSGIHGYTQFSGKVFEYDICLFAVY